MHRGLVRFFTLLALFFAVSHTPVHAQYGVKMLEDEAEPTGYDVSAKAAKLPVEWWMSRQENGDAYRFTVAPGSVKLGLQRGGKVTPLASVETAVAPGADLAFQRRGRRWNVLVNDRIVLQAEDDTWNDGQVGYRGTLSDVRLQPVEPINFTDDFMRVAADVAMRNARINPRAGVKIKDAQFEEDIWTPVQGSWQTTGLTENTEAQVAQSANPFAFKSNGKGVNVAVAGRAFWSDYEASVAVQPQGASAVGLLVYAQDANNYLGLFWPANEGPQLRAVVAGKVTVLDKEPGLGGIEQKQWYRLKLSIVDGLLSGYVDDVPVLRARSLALGRGRVGLLAQGATEANSATFDDAQVRSLTDVSDDFGTVVPGRWKSIAGTWSWNQAARPTGPQGSYAVMGETEWSDYRVGGQLSVPADGSAGLVLHHVPGQGAYVLRVTGSHAAWPQAGKVELLRIAGGKVNALAEVNTGTRFDNSKARWNFSDERGYLRAEVDGTFIVDAFDEALRSGRPGVYGQKGKGAAPAVAGFDVHFPTARRTWAVVPDLYEMEQQAQTMGGWSTPQGMWVASRKGAGADRVLWHKGAFWGDDSLRFELPTLTAGQSVQLIFRPSTDRELKLTLTAQSGLEAALTDGKKQWQGKLAARESLAGKPVEVSRRGRYIIVRVGPQDDQKLVLAALAG